MLPFGDNGPESLRTINADAIDILHTRDTWGKQLLSTNPPDRRTPGMHPKHRTASVATHRRHVSSGERLCAATRDSVRSRLHQP